MRISPGTGQAREGEQPITGFLRAVGDRLALEVPFAQERLPAGFDPGCGPGIDHVAVVLGQFIAQISASAVFVSR